MGVENSHDLTGRIFQRLIADRKYLATFYTLPASAALLARLAVAKLRGVDWSDAAAIGKLRVADSETVFPSARRAITPSSLLRSRPGAVSSQAFHTSHHTSQTGRPTRMAQTAISAGPSSPAGSVTAAVTAPSATPAIQAPRR